MPRPSVREQIIDAAADRFHALGFNGCGVQEIVDAAGVPKGSFYNHFKSKEGLALTVLERYVAANSISRLTDPTSPPLERLKGHFETLSKRFAAAKYKRGCLVGNLSTEMSDSSPQLREALEIILRDWSKAIAKLLRQAQSNGEMARHHHPETASRFILSAWEGAIARAKVDKSPVPLDDFFAIVFGTLLR